jgi:hypothetical protein
MMTVMYINPPENQGERLGDLSPNTNRSYVDGNFNDRYIEESLDYQSDEFLEFSDLAEFHFDDETNSKDLLEYQDSFSMHDESNSEPAAKLPETLFDDEFDHLLEDNN